MSYDYPEDPFTTSPVKQILITVYVSIFVLGFTGNLMVIFVIAKNKSMRTVTNFFLGNLAVSDFLAMTFSVIPIMFGFISESWQLGDTVCKSSHYLVNVTTTTSILILAVISAERYMAILHPFELRQLVTTKLLSITVSVVWAIALCLGLPTFFSYHVVDFYGNKFCAPTAVQHDFAAVQNIAKIFFLYLLPLTVMCILYGAIGRTLWASSPDVKFSQSNGERHSKDKKKAAKVSYSPASSVVTFSTTTNPPSEMTGHVSKQLAADEESPNSGKVGPFLLEEPVEQDVDPSGDSDFSHDGNDNVRIVRTNQTFSSPASKISTSVPNRDKKWSIFKPLGSKPLSGAAGFKSLTSSRNSKRRRKTQAVRAARRKAVRMLSIIALCFALCLFPMQLVAVLQTVNDIFEVSFPVFTKPWLYPFTYACYFLNSALNPFLYAFLSNNFRKKFLETITCQTNRKRRGNARRVQRLKSVTSDVQTELVYVS